MDVFNLIYDEYPQGLHDRGHVIEDVNDFMKHINEILEKNLKNEK